MDDYLPARSASAHASALPVGVVLPHLKIIFERRMLKFFMFAVHGPKTECTNSTPLKSYLEIYLSMSFFNVFVFNVFLNIFVSVLLVKMLHEFTCLCMPRTFSLCLVGALLMAKTILFLV